MTSGNKVNPLTAFPEGMAAKSAELAKQAIDPSGTLTPDDLLERVAALKKAQAKLDAMDTGTEAPPENAAVPESPPTSTTELLEMQRAQKLPPDITPPSASSDDALAGVQSGAQSGAPEDVKDGANGQTSGALSDNDLAELKKIVAQVQDEDPVNEKKGPPVG